MANYFFAKEYPSFRFIAGRTMTKIVMTSYEPHAHVGFLLDRWWLPHVQVHTVLLPDRFVN